MKGDCLPVAASIWAFEKVYIQLVLIIQINIKLFQKPMCHQQ